MATLVYLYKYREYVHLLQADKNVPNLNLPMIIYDTKIYKGVTNTIDFVIRNNDRKPVNLVGFGMVAQIRRSDNVSNAKTFPEVLLEKPITVVDELSGKAKLVLDPDEIENWPTGFYMYTVRTVNQSGVEELLFTDINKQTWNNFELIEGISNSVVPPITIPSEKFTPQPIGYSTTTRWYTGALPGDAQVERASGTHTIAAYTTNWQGKIWVEGSLSNQPPLPSEWFFIPLSTDTDYLELTPSNNTSPKLINFTMNLYWIRFSYEPNPQNKGKFDKILYKT